MTPTNSIHIAMADGTDQTARMRTWVDLFAQTGLYKSGLFVAEDGREFIAGKHTGQWAEIDTIGGRPAIDVVREILAISAPQFATPGGSTVATGPGF